MAEPEWYSKHSSEKELSRPCLKVTILEETDTHDGYCSDQEDFQVIQEIIVVYVPWVFYELVENSKWEVEQGHCICCNASVRYTVQKIDCVI